ncbi:MAG TPA: carboxypeptidase-like regulatory domain-containing protein [Planctomycetota bacterium]|nr:carboxypeptidase-like regulatory domain-containing protein [Planctomycetota bacterium]
MNRSRAVLVLSVVLVVAAGLAVTAFLGRGSGETGDAGVFSAPARSDEQALSLGALGEQASRAPAELAGSGAPVDGAADAARAAAANGAGTEATRSIAGHVSMADGGVLPAGLVVVAFRARPAPHLSSLRDTVGNREAWNGEDGDDGDGTKPPFGGGEHHGSWSPEPAATPRAAVGADGSFLLAGVPARTLWLTVDDALLYADPAVRVGAGESAAELRLVRGATLAGRLTGPDGEPVVKGSVGIGTRFDPFVVFDRSARMLELTVQADADGRYVARQVPAGLALLVAASTGAGRLQPRTTEIRALQPGEARTLDLSLPVGNSVAGRVVTEDKTPLAGARVRLSRLDQSMLQASMASLAGNALQADMKSDGEGRFRFAPVPDGEYEVVLGDTSWRQVHSAKLALKDGAEVRDVLLVTDPGLAIAGRVLDESGQPVKGASVKGFKPPSMMSMRSSMDQALRASVTTGADGRFRISGFDAGALRVTARAEGFKPGRLDAQAGDEEVVLTLAALTSVSGIVVSLSDGEPVPDFRVSLLPEGGLFDLANMDKMEERMGSVRASHPFHGSEDGTFTLKDVPPGSYDLTVTSTGFASTKLAGVEVDASGARGLVVMLPPEAMVSGTIVSGRDGLPIDGAVVTTSKGGMMSVMTDSIVGSGPEATTGSDGTFKLKGLTGNATLSLTVKHPAFRELALAEQVLVPGEARDLGRIALATGACVHGHVLDTGGAPVPGTTVMASNITGSVIKRSSADDSGAYRIEGLPPGSYNVMRLDMSMSLGSDNPGDIMKDMVFRLVTLADSEDKEVDLTPKATGGTHLTGHVRASDGVVTTAVLNLIPERGGLAGMQFSTTYKEGRYEISGVAAGSFVLQVTVLDGSNQATAGQATSPIAERIVIGGLPEQQHDVQLPGGEIHGSVESELDGAMLPGVRVLLERVDEGRPDFGLAAATHGRVGESYTSAQGGFRFRFLPEGSYELVAGGQNLIGMGAQGWAQTRVQDVSPSMSGPGFGVRIKVRPSGGIEGFVHSTAGSPLSGVGVWVADGNGAWQSTLSEIASDAGGAYSVGALQEGSWTLAFRDGSHALKLVAGVLVKEGKTTRQDVSLQPGVALQLATGGHTPGSLQTTLIGPDGPVPTGLVAMGDLMTMTDLGSALNLGTFAPGSYHLTVTSGGEALLSTTVTLSGTAPVTLSLDS